MTSESVLQLLPHRGLDQSILLAILVGLLVLLIFTEILGWVFVGLVVPGYLSSVFVIQPSMGVTIIFEAVITYMLVRFLSDILARTTIWSPFFGRERFFVIVLVSVFVRQNSQIWLLPTVLGWVDWFFGTDYTFDSSEFSSIGLVLVPLVANMFWKINLRRGCLQIGIPVLVTYGVLVLVLLPYTNLSFSSIEITYDNVALNFLSSPKAYIVLLVSAILAARFNVLYGWDYNGILVPSLLALGWLEPMSIVVTVIEVMVLYTTTKLVLASPMLRTANLEGPRQIALVFSIGFLLKYILAWMVSEYQPHVNVIDLFGFGYVITSLITVKMLQKKVIGRVLFPTLHVSIIGFVCGSLVGYGLEQIEPRQQQHITPIEEKLATTETLLRNTLGAMLVGKVRARSAPFRGMSQGRPSRELAQYSHLFADIDEWLADPATRNMDEIRKKAERLRLSFRRLPEPTAGRTTYVILEKEERFERQTGWDTVVLIPGAPGPVLEVPRPRTEPLTAELAAILCENIECRAIIVAGIDSADGGRTTGDALAHARATSFIAGQSLVSAPIVQVRVDRRVKRQQARLHHRHKLPEQVRVKRFWPAELDIGVALSWRRPSRAGRRWELRDDVVALFLRPDDVWRIVLDYAHRRSREPEVIAEVSLKSWLQETFGRVRTVGVSQTVPSQSEVRFIGTELATRLLERKPGRLPWLNLLAGLVDHRVVELANCTGEVSCWVLTETARPVRHRWGTLAVRKTAGFTALGVEAPRPQLESGTWQIALDMWVEEDGFALLVGHDMPATHGVPVLDPARFGNVSTPFHAMHQSVHRALSDMVHPRNPLPFIAQIRGYATWRDNVKALVIGLGPPALVESRQVPVPLKRILASDGYLGWLSTQHEFAKGGPEYITLAGQGNPQLSFTHSVDNIDMALLWFSQPTRALFVGRTIESARPRLESAGFELTPLRPEAFLRDSLPPRPNRPALDVSRFENLIDMAERYALTEDISVLRRLGDLVAEDPLLSVKTHWSSELASPFIALTMDGPEQVRRAVVLLSREATHCKRRLDEERSSPRDLEIALLVDKCRALVMTHRRRTQ